MLEAKELNKRGKAAKSAPAPGNEGAASGVSQVRGTDNPGENHPGRDGLPGVQPSDPVGNTPKLPQKPRPVAKTAMTDTILETRISRLNAYRKLLKKLPKLPGFDPATQEIIEREYINWVRERIAAVLGGAQEGSAGFSDQETQVLKEFAARMINKAGNIASQPTVSAPPKSPTTIQQQLIEPNPNARPMRERAPASNNSRQYHDATQRQLDDLSRMDRSGPEF